MRILAKRVMQQMHGDRRTLALMVFAPLLVLTFIYFLLGDTNYVPTIAVVEEGAPAPILAALEEEEADILLLDAAAEGQPDALLEDGEAEGQPVALLKDGEADAVVRFGSDGITVDMLQSGAKSGKAMEALQAAIHTVNPASDMAVRFVYGDEDQSTFSSMSYVFIGVFSFFFVFIISGMALIRERTGGTLERLLTAPVRRRAVILGYTAGYSVFAVIQAALITSYSILVLGVSCAGNLEWVILIMLLLAVTAVSFGAMISTLANSEFQMVQLIPVTLIPQIFFSGLIDLETMPYGLGNLCYITPIYYGCAGIRKVLVEGAGFSGIWFFLAALLTYTGLLCIVNTLLLKRYRQL
ncbi:MAG: ABC transporter permease [Clostridiales Family XIII bacterium]|jgi:ABC-2 type transport system permease protein|nr:ABC transporter permease [Clostridiales Family XIII bacterium]